MTTNKELQNWLKQFPDDIEIRVITSSESRGYWESYRDSSKVELILPEYTNLLENPYDQETVEVDRRWIDDGTYNGKYEVASLTLGKKE